MAPTLLGIIPYMAIQFTVYEQLSATFSRYSKAFSGGNAAASDNDPYNSNGSADVYNGRTEGRNDVVATASTCKDDDERRKRKTGRGCSSSTKASDTETNTRSTNTTIATNAGDVHNTSPQAELLAAGKFVSGFCAGIIGKACTMPFDVVKKRLQVQHFDYERSAAGTSGGMHQPSADKGGRHCSSSVTNRDSGSVKGKSTSNIENNDNNGNGDRSRNHNKQTPNDRHTTMSKSRAITHHQSTGPSARAPAAATTSTSESSSLNFLRYTRTLVKQEGIMSLYRGMVPTILKAGPNSAILFFVHDQVSTLLKRRRNSHTLHAHDDL